MSYLAVISTPSIFDNLDITENTKRDYLARLPKFVGWLHRNGISHDTLLQYKRYLRSRSDLGIASKNKYLAVARIALKELHRRGNLSVDISQNVKGFRQSQVHKVAGLNEEEVTRICEMVSSQSSNLRTARLKAILALLIFQGLRQIEICRLDITDLELTVGELNVLGKGRDDKEPIHLHPQTITALRSYLKQSKVKHGPLFTSLWGQSRGTRLTTRGLRHIVKQAMMEVGVEKTVHGFRHYFATTLIENYQSDLLRVAKYTRHRSTDMLMAYNDRITDKADLRRFYSSFRAELSPTPKQD